MKFIPTPKIVTVGLVLALTAGCSMQYTESPAPAASGTVLLHPNQQPVEIDNRYIDTYKCASGRMVVDLTFATGFRTPTRKVVLRCIL